MVDINTNESITIPAFSDSVDVSGTYTIGICGEKVFAIDSSFPFLKVTSGANPLVDPLTINFDPTVATEADVGFHIVTYTVNNKEYESILNPPIPLSGSIPNH